MSGAAPPRTRAPLRAAAVLALALPLLAACGGDAPEGGGGTSGDREEPERRRAAVGDSVVTVRQSALDLAGLSWVRPRPGRLRRSVTLVGRLETDPALRSVVRAPAPGRFELEVSPGRRVGPGDTVGWMRSPDTYPDSVPLTAPAAGDVVELPQGRAGLVSGWAPVAVVSSADTLRLVVQVPPDHYEDVRKGTQLVVRRGLSSGGPEGRDRSGAPATRVEVTGFLRPSEGRAPLRALARVPNPGGALQPGMRVAVIVQLSGSVRGHWLPDPAVLYGRRRPGRTLVYLREPDGYRQMPVEVEGRTADSVFVTSGLDSTDRVVAEGAYQLLYADFSFRGIGAEAGEMEEGEEDDGGP